jgi:hypothetical protein
MEIVIRTDGSEQASVQGMPGAAAQTATQTAEPPPSVAAKAEAIGAINAGPAHVPSGATGEPIPDVVAAVFAEPSGNGSSELSAGSAAGYGEEAAAMIVEAEGEE